MKEVGEVLRCEGMKGFIGWKEDFAVDTELKWEPIKVEEGWGDALPGLGVDENPGG